MPEKDSDIREFLKNHRLASIVVSELRVLHPSSAGMAKLTGSPENCFWKMYKMRRRFMDGCTGQLFQAKADAKSRSWGPCNTTSDNEDDDTESIEH